MNTLINRRSKVRGKKAGEWAAESPHCDSSHRSAWEPFRGPAPCSPPAPNSVAAIDLTPLFIGPLVGGYSNALLRLRSVLNRSFNISECRYMFRLVQTCHTLDHYHRYLLNTDSIAFNYINLINYL